MQARTFWTAPVAGGLVPLRRYDSLTLILGIVTRVATVAAFSVAVWVYAGQSVTDTAILSSPRAGYDCQVPAMQATNLKSDVQTNDQAGIVRADPCWCYQKYDCSP